MQVLAAAAGLASLAAALGAGLASLSATLTDLYFAATLSCALHNKKPSTLPLHAVLADASAALAFASSLSAGSLASEAVATTKGSANANL